MKKLFNLFLIGGFFTLMLCSCNMGRDSINVDGEILQSLPDSVRQDALYRMITSVENYNDHYFTFWGPLARNLDDLIIAFAVCVFLSVSILILVYMLLKSRIRILNAKLEITEKMFDRIERLQSLNINISEAKSLIPYQFAEKKNPFMFNATILGVGLGLFLFGIISSEDALIGVGALVFAIGLLRLLAFFIISYYNKKSNHQ